MTCPLQQWTIQNYMYHVLGKKMLTSRFTQYFEMGAPSCWPPKLGFDQPMFSAGTSWWSIIFGAIIMNVNPLFCTTLLHLPLLHHQ